LLSNALALRFSEICSSSARPDPELLVGQEFGNSWAKKGRLAGWLVQGGRPKERAVNDLTVKRERLFLIPEERVNMVREY
jgi:hypothetical protein